MSKEDTKTEEKEKKTKTKKEEVSEVKFDLDKQSKVKFFSKFIYILAKIGKVCSILVAVCLLIGVIVAPVFTKNIKIENNELYVFNEKIHYVHDKNDIILKYNNLDIGTISGEEATDFDIAINELSNVNIASMFGVVEFYLVVALAMCVVVYMLFNYLDKLFKNIHNLDTPFTEENINYVKKITYLVIVLVVGPYICGLIGQILVKSKMIHFEIDLIYLLYILILFSITYIFEYGYELQKDTKAKIYGDIN